MMAPLAMSFVDPWGNILEERNADSLMNGTSSGCNDGHLDKAMLYAD
jgi:hypothetical protein